eukprot:gene8396-10312_t
MRSEQQQLLVHNDFTSVIGRLPLSIIISTIFAIHGYRKGSLSLSGAISAWIVGVISCSSNWMFGITLLSFYLSSSKLTKYKSSIKKQLEDNHKEGGNRNYIQVFSNSLTATIISAIFIFISPSSSSTTFIDFNYNYYTSFLICSLIGHYGCCNGDTWASELGILSKDNPILITTMKRVPKGTNGGISSLGMMASIAGGTFIGLVYYLLNPLFNRSIDPSLIHSNQIYIILLGTFAGTIGSLVCYS